MQTATALMVVHNLSDGKIRPVPAHVQMLPVLSGTAIQLQLHLKGGLHGAQGPRGRINLVDADVDRVQLRGDGGAQLRLRRLQVICTSVNADHWCERRPDGMSCRCSDMARNLHRLRVMYVSVHSDHWRKRKD